MSLGIPEIEQLKHSWKINFCSMLHQRSFCKQIILGKNSPACVARYYFIQLQASLVVHVIRPRKLWFQRRSLQRKVFVHY